MCQTRQRAAFGCSPTLPAPRAAPSRPLGAPLHMHSVPTALAWLRLCRSEMSIRAWPLMVLAGEAALLGASTPQSPLVPAEAWGDSRPSWHLAG